MTTDELEKMLNQAALPEPRAGLRERILAGPAQARPAKIFRLPALVKWAAAALICLSGLLNWLAESAVNRQMAEINALAADTAPATAAGADLTREFGVQVWGFGGGARAPLVDLKTWQERVRLVIAEDENDQV